MSLSENPLGCSPAAVKALKKINIKNISQYPDTTKLTNILAKRFNVPSRSILLGCGSEQLIKLIAQEFINKGDPVLVQSGSFPMFTKECQLAGARIIFFQPNEKFSNNSKAKIIFICNPNNPTGEVINNKIIANILNKAKKSLVVIDEANGEFINTSFMKQAIKRQNCLVLKTFSKAFGLAGLRIGVAIGSPALIRQLSTSQQAFPVSSIACQLATTAIKDKKFIGKTLDFISKERKFLTKRLRKKGFIVSNSVTNTLFIKTRSANNLITILNKLGVSIIADSFFPGIKDQGFRIAIRNKKTNRLFLKKIDQALSCMKLKKLIISKSI